MTDLSPAAQAVWDAYELVDCDAFRIDPRQAGVAAALMAAADQVVSEPNDWDKDNFSLMALRLRCVVRAELLAIAAELRGKGDNQ